MQHAKSEAAFEEAKQYIPGGVNSPVRSFRSVGGVPPIIAGGCGSKLTDIDGNEYIDYVLSYGPLLLGHAHPLRPAAFGARSSGCYRSHQKGCRKRFVLRRTDVG